MNKTQRKILIICAIIFAFAVFNCRSHAQVSAVETSLNPHDKNFCLFWNDKLDIQSIEGNLNFLRMFNKSPDYSHEYNFYFVLERNYYQIWLPQENLFFIVKGKEGVPVNYHLVQFCNILKLWKEKEKLVITKSKTNYLCQY